MLVGLYRVDCAVVVVVVVVLTAVVVVSLYEHDEDAADN